MAADYENQLDEFSLDAPIVAHENYQWANYVRGVVKHLQLRNNSFGGVDMVIHLDTAWDGDPRGNEKHAVRELVFPLVLSGEDGAVPVIDEAKLPQHMYAMLAATAGVSAAGRVEISGEGLAEGQRVVVPQR